VLATKLAGFQVASAEESKRGRRVGVATSKYLRARRRMHCTRKWPVVCLLQLRDRRCLSSGS